MPISIGPSPLSSLGSSFSDELNSSSQGSSNAAALASQRRPQAKPSGLPFEVLPRRYLPTHLPSTNPRHALFKPLPSARNHPHPPRRQSLPSTRPPLLLLLHHSRSTSGLPHLLPTQKGNPRHWRREAQLKWSYVREICIVSDPFLPLSTSTRATVSRLAVLELPPTNFLERFCFLDYYTDFGFLHELQREDLSGQKKKLAFDKEVQNKLTGFVRTLASDGTIFVLTSDFLESLPTKATFDSRALKLTPSRLEVHDTLALQPEQAQELIKHVKYVTEEKPVHLVGFSPLFVLRFEKEVERMKRKDRGFRLEFSWDV